MRCGAKYSEDSRVVATAQRPDRRIWNGQGVACEQSYAFTVDRHDDFAVLYKQNDITLGACRQNLKLWANEVAHDFKSVRPRQGSGWADKNFL